MVREYGGDHIDLSGAEVGRDLIGKVEHHYHHPVAARKPPLGKPLGDLSPADAHTFEVHEVADPTGGDELPPLPPYLYRPDVDDPLRAAVRDAQNTSGLVLLVGGSSVGKTRACWEAVHAELPAEWRLWHPLTPTRTEALQEALRADRVTPHTVVWLNEAQLYLRQPEVLEALQGLLADASRGPVLVLGSLWPEYWRELHDEASTGREGRHLLDRARDIIVPGSFTSAELHANVDLSSTDRRLLWALREGDEGQVTQALSGALDLLRRYRHGTPAERAVLEVAMDVSRSTEYVYHLSPRFLRAAAPGYLSPTERSRLSRNWFTTVLRSLTRRGPGTPGPLMPSSIKKRVFVLPDYLSEYGLKQRRHLCPPTSLWEALSRPEGKSVVKLAPFVQAAEDRLLLRHADAILRNDTPTRFISRERGEVLERRARLRTRAGDLATAERLATDAALSGRPDALLELVDATDRPEYTLAAFVLLQQTEGIEWVVEEITLRFPTASEEGKCALVGALHQGAGADGLLALVELLRPLRDRAGIRLCMEHIDPDEAETAEAEQSVWEADRDRRIGQAIEHAKAFYLDPLNELLSEESHPLHLMLRGEIARRCVSAGLIEPILQPMAPFRGPSSPHTYEGWPTHPEFIEALAESGDPEVLREITKAALSAKDLDSGARFLELAVQAGTRVWDLLSSLESLAVSGRTEVVERLLNDLDDSLTRELALRLRLRRGDLAGAERLAFPEGGTGASDREDRLHLTEVQRILIRYLRRRGDTATAEHLARRSVEHNENPQVVRILAEILTEQGYRAEAIDVLAADDLDEVALEEIVGCLLTEPAAVEAAERMRRPGAPWWNGPLLCFLAWAAKAAGDDERARVLWPRNGEFIDEALLRYLHRFTPPASWEEGREGEDSQRETTGELARHLRDGTPITLARHLAARVGGVPGFTHGVGTASDRPAGHPRTFMFGTEEHHHGHLGILLAWTSHLYRNQGEPAAANELEELSLRVSGSGAVPSLVRGYLNSGEHARVPALLGFLGAEVADSRGAFERSEFTWGRPRTLLRSRLRSYHWRAQGHAQRVLVHVVRAGAMHLAEDVVDSFAETPASEFPQDIRFMSDAISPVDPLLEAARPDLALLSVRWLREHQCYGSWSEQAEELELEGDWANAARFHELSLGHGTGPERVAALRAAAGLEGPPDASAPAALLEHYVHLEEEKGDHREAERIARAGATTGRGSILRGLAHRRIERGDDPEYWRTMLTRGLTPDGDLESDWCETTEARGDLRPMVVHSCFSSLVPRRDAPVGFETGLVFGPYAFNLVHCFVPLFFLMSAPIRFETFVLTTGGVSLSLALALLPWLTAKARRRWPLSLRAFPGLLLGTAFWGPAAAGVLSAALAERRSRARDLVTVVTAPLSLFTASAFSVFSFWLDPLGAAVMSLSTVYTFLALAYRSHRKNHRRYLAGLRVPG